MCEVKMTRFKSFQAYLLLCHRIYSCTHCSAHKANHDELLSKPFQGSQRGACLFNLVVNMGCGPAEKQVSQTGWHTVADIYCENCKTTLGGWKYEHAFENNQKSKEDKYIIQLAHMIKNNGWD
uniref:Protein yippee-like n=1 Tax=Spermophilus dauricus TaxID=99837 RepID=A0A8C9PFJ3_SPEDA